MRSILPALLVPAIAATPASALSLNLDAQAKSEIRNELLAQKPSPGLATLASFMVPGSAQLAMGEFPTGLMPYALIVAGSLALNNVREMRAGRPLGPYIHLDAFATMPKLLFQSQSGLPQIGNAADPYDQAMSIWWVGVAVWSAWDAYQMAERRRADLDRKIQLLDK